MQVTGEKGFTLVELVTVIVLLSVIGVVAFGRLANLSSIENRGFFDDTVAALRYAQKLAISTGCEVRVTLTANSYLLQQESNCGSAVFNRNVVNPVDRTSTYTATAPSAIGISPTGIFTFSPQAFVSGLGSDTTFTIDSYQFVLYRNTGLIDVL